MVLKLHFFLFEEQTKIIIPTLYLLLGSGESKEVLVGDVTTHQLHNLQPGTTYDVKVLAQYNAGESGPLVGEGTTRENPKQLPTPPIACLERRGLTAELSVQCT